MGETGINTSSYIENTSFPTNQERSIKDNASLNASSFSNHSPAVNLDAPMLRIPMIGESKNILLYDIKNSTSSTTHERNTDDKTFHNDIIQSRLKGLPDGWVSEIRYTGLSNSRFKVYIDPKSGYEFRSLKDAQRYILSKDISHCVVKPKKRKSFESQTEGRELHSQHGDWLPPGWVVNTRTQNGGKCHGLKKKIYYNPSTGLQFYSKVKLFQHLDAQKLLISAIRETSSVKTSYFNNASSPTNHQQSQINNSFNVLTEVSSKSLPNTWRTEITNSQKGAPEYQVPSSIRSEREDCGPSRCHFSDNCPNLDVNIMANMRKSVRSSSLPSQGIVVDNSSCASLYLNCLVGENSEEIRLVNELSPACLVGASSIQATNLGEEWPFNLEAEDLSQFFSCKAYNTGNEPQKTMQQFSELVTDECLFKIPVQMSQVRMTAPELTPSPSLRRQDEGLPALYGNLAIEGNFEMSGEVSQPIKHTHELGSTTSMVVEAIRKQYQASKQVAAFKCYQMMHSGGEEQFDEVKANAFCQLQAETASILNQPARSNLATGSFYQQEGAPFVDLVLPYEHASMQISTGPTSEQEKGDAILDQPAQSNLFTGSFYRQDEAAPYAFCQLQTETASILNQPARSNLATGSFYQQKGAPFVDLVLPYAHASMQVSTEPTADLEKGVAILDQPAQSNLFTRSFYRRDEAAPFGEQAQLGRSDSEKQKSLDAFAFGNSWPDPYLNIFTRDAPDFEYTDKVVQYFQLEEHIHNEVPVHKLVLAGIGKGYASSRIHAARFSTVTISDGLTMPVL